MKLRKITRLLIIPALLLVAVLGAWSWLLHSESGAHWLFNRLDSAIPASVRFSRLSGDLGSGLTLAGLHYDDGSQRVEAKRLEIAVNIDLLPPSINLETVRADGITIRVLKDTGEETGQQSNVQDIIPGLALPLPLKFPDIRISDLKFIDLTGADTLVVNSVVAAGALHESLRLDRLQISMPENDFSLAGELGLSAPHPVSLDFQAGGDFTLRGGLEGDLESAEVSLISESPQLEASGTLEQLLADPAWNLTVSSPLVQWPLDDPESEMRLLGLDLKTSGQLTNYRLELEGNLELQGLEPSRLALAGDGTREGFSARSLSLTGPELALDASGEFSWANDLQLSLDAALQRLDPRKWVEGWPDEQPANGQISLEWGGDKLNVAGFSLAVAGTGLTVSGNGVFDIPSGVVEAELSWNDVSWPPGSAQAVFNSKTGRFLVGGQPEQWELDGELAFQAGDLPEGQVQLSGTGNRESLDLVVDHGTILGGVVSGKAGWNWTGAKPFELELSADDIDITALAPQYPGILNTRLTASGEVEPLSLRVDLQRLDGTILGQPVNAAGGFHLEQEMIVAHQLQLQSGDSTLSLDGSPYEPGGISFAANINALEQFSKELNGQISAQGKASLHPDSPQFTATLSGQDLKFGSVEIEKIETHEQAGPNGEPGREFVFSGLLLNGRSFESLAVRLSGAEPLQDVGLQLKEEDKSIRLGLQGSVNDWADPWASGWSGALSEFRLERTDKFNLTLDEEAHFDLNASGMTLENACLSGTLDGQICLASSWRRPGEINVNADIVAIPLALMDLFVETDVRFSQVINGTLNWSQASAGQRDGDARFEISPGTIKFKDDDEVLTETGAALFGFELADGQLQKGRFDINFPGSGIIDIDFSIPDLSLGPDSPVQGSTVIDLEDVGVLGRMLQVFDTIDGLLDVDLTLSGTLSDPAFKGTVAITNGHIEDLASGFSFSEINLTGAVSKLDRSELTGSFRAGEGAGKINTTIYFEDILSPVIEFTLEGDSLTLIDVPDLKVVANPDIGLNWRNNTLEIDGSLHIPAARLSPSYLPKSSVPQSKDVVIVAGKLPIQDASKTDKNPVALRGNLEVSLGDEILIDLDVAQINVTGGARLNWRDELIPIADGAFDLSGEIRAFGQFLRVTQGRIGFPEIPADNPHLNIRAEREIFGNSQIRRAGLMVAGTVRRPVLEAYTVPMTNKHRAQTLLVTGSDFNYEQGVGAVDVGMYVLPRLYISYGIGVFEDGNVIKARYDIGRGFGIRATSGQRETGLDISYTIER